MLINILENCEIEDVIMIFIDYLYNTSQQKLIQFTKM